MSKTPPPVVRFDAMKAEGYPTAIRVASPAWFDWLVNHRSFRYESSEGSFTANKESRKAGMFWYANRRVNGQLRRAYLGASEDLSLEKLVEVAAKLSGNRQSYTTSESCVTDSCVASENQELLKQLLELREQLTQAKYKISSLENENVRLKKLGQDYSQETVAKLSQKYAKSLKEVQHWQETAEGYKRQAMKLRDELNEVQGSQASSVDALKVANILHEALKLKANAGGAIKAKIKEALLFIDDV